MKEKLKNLLSKLKINKVIKYQELKYLNELLKSDLPIKTCLNLISDNTNSKIIDSLISMLDKGMMIENIIKDYLPKEIYVYMIHLLETLTFSKSLDLSLSYYEKSIENSKYLYKAIAYPILLLFISMSGLYLFNNYGFSLIINMLKSFEIDLTFIRIMRLVMICLTNIFYISFLILLILFLYFKSPKRITLAYIFMCKYIPIEFIKTYFSEDFMSLYILTSSLGYKTKETLTILKSLRNKPIVALISYHTDEMLMKGNSFKVSASNPYLDNTLSKFINIASYSKNSLAILNNYVEFASMKIRNKMHLYSLIVQFISYAFIGFIVVFIYQILFLPMQALNVI